MCDSYHLDQAILNIFANLNHFKSESATNAHEIVLKIGFSYTISKFYYIN